MYLAHIQKICKNFHFPHILKILGRRKPRGTANKHSQRNWEGQFTNFNTENRFDRNCLIMVCPFWRVRPT